MSALSFTLDKRRQGNITVNRTIIEGEGEQIVIVLHKTAVVVKQANGDIHLNTNGWQTVTTKTAMNRAFSLLGLNVGIFQKKGKWLISIDNEVVDYFDGLCIKNTKLERLLSA